MTIDEFTAAFPQYTFDFGASMRAQERVYDPFVLDGLPVMLEATHPYHAGSRGRPNLNQTRTHSQCAKCKRVLRNDMFYTPASSRRRNMVHTNCRECAQRLNAERYDMQAALIRDRRIVVWQYLAPSCAICGFDTHVSALDMHHLTSKDFLIADLITAVTFTPGTRTVENLLREASKCIPLCSNCHRMFHAGVIAIPDAMQRPDYSLADLLRRLRALESQ